MALADSIIGAESGGDQQARNPRSTAFGQGQFLAGTWLQMLAKYRPDLVRDHDQQYLLALRGDPKLSRAMTDAYAQENAAYLRKNGIADTPGNTYLAHFAGPGGALKLFQGNPDQLATETLGPDVAKANPFLKGMSNADVIAWAKMKMGHEPLSPPRPPMPIPNVPPQPPQALPPQAAPPELAAAPAPGPLPAALEAAPPAPEQAALPPNAQPAQGMLPAALLAQMHGRALAPQGPPPQPGAPMAPPIAGQDPQVGGMLNGLMRQILASPMGGDQAAIDRQRSFGG